MRPGPGPALLCRPHAFGPMPASTMRAVVFDAPGAPDVLRLGDVPRPAPGAGEVLVRVRATALNRADLLQREGKYPPPPGASDVLGLELAGEVAEAGPGVTALAPGDRVCALLAGGGYAEYAVVPAALCLRLPDALTFEDAAALPEAFLTAFQALVLLADTQPGDHVLVHAGASGVGTAAVQLARLLGAHAHATASAPKHDALRALGAATTIDYRTEEFDVRVLEATGGHGADVVLDVIGGAYVAANLRALARDGRWVLLATMGGAVAEALDLRALMAKRLTLFATTLRGRSLGYKARLTERFRAEAWPAVADGRLRPVVDAVLPWTEAAEAHRRMAANANVGKIVLRVDAGG